MFYVPEISRFNFFRMILFLIFRQTLIKISHPKSFESRKFGLNKK